MSGKLAFALPENDLEVRAALVEAIPLEWSWVNGQLDAPLELVALGRAANRAGFKIDRWRFELDTLMKHPWATGTSAGYEEVWNKSMYIRQAMLELLAEARLPGYINFHHAGFDAGDNGPLPLATIKQMAAAYIRRGYTGDLMFYSDCYHNREFDNPEQCDIHLAAFDEWGRRSQPIEQIVPYQGDGSQLDIEDHIRRNSPPKRRHLAMVVLEWDTQFGGKKQNLKPLLDVCKQFKLQELDASDIRWGASFSQPIQ